MADLHPLIADPIASYNLLPEHQEKVNQAFTNASRASIFGQFEKARDILDRVGVEATALPGYHCLLAELLSRQGAVTSNAIRQALERVPDDTGHSAFKDLCNLVLHLGFHALGRENRVVELVKDVSARWLVQRSPSDYDYLTVRLLLGVLEASSHQPDSPDGPNFSASSTAIVVFDHFLSIGQASLVFDLANCILDANTSDGLPLVAQLIFKVRSSSAPNDWAQPVLLAVLQLRHAQNLVLGNQLLEARDTVSSARFCFQALGHESGALDAAYLDHVLDTVENPRLLTFGSNSTVAGLLEKAGNLQYYQLQSNILKTFDKVLFSPSKPQDALRVCYAWKDISVKSGHQLSTTALGIIAEHEVMQTEDVFEVLGYCDVLENRVDQSESPDAVRTTILYVRTLAYSRLKNYDQTVRTGVALLEVLKRRGSPVDQMMLALVAVVLQGYAALLGRAELPMFNETLRKLTDWFDMQLEWLGKQGQSQIPPIRSALALEICISFLHIGRIRESEGVVIVALVVEAIRKYVGMIQYLPRERAVEAFVVRGELLAMQCDYQAAISILSEDLRLPALANINEEQSRAAYIRFCVGVWRIKEAEAYPERGSELTALALDDLQHALGLHQVNFEELGRASDVSMLISANYFLAVALRLQGRYNRSDAGEDDNSKSLQASYAALLDCVKLVDRIRVPPTPSMLDAYAAYTDILTQSRISIPQLLDAIMCVAPKDHVWKWIQWAKGRGLAHMLMGGFNMDDVAFQRCLDDVKSLPPGMPHGEVGLDGMQILASVSALQRKISGAQYPERLELKRQLAILEDRLLTFPELRGCFRMASGSPAVIEDVKWISRQGSPSESMLFVDYFTIGNSIYFTYVQVNSRSNSTTTGHMPPPDVMFTPGADVGSEYSGWHEPVLIKELTKTDVREWKNTYLRKDELRCQELMESFKRLLPLIQPLLELCGEDWLLIISPDALMNEIPLHAIPIENDPLPSMSMVRVLLNRNPVVYMPSIAAMRQCVDRAKHRIVEPKAGDSNANFVGVRGVYSEQRAKDRLPRLAANLSAKATCGSELDKTRFLYKASRSTNVFHVQGYQQNEDRPLSEQYLEFDSSERLGVHEIAEIKFPDKCSPLVTFMACSSESQQGPVSEEALGMIPFFLSAGSSSVLGGLWSTRCYVNMTFCHKFYKAYRAYEDDENCEFIDLARAVQKAALDLRRWRPGPYFWAPFVLTGSWFRRKPGKGSRAESKNVDLSSDLHTVAVSVDE